jgi:hypothetical protein
MKKTSGTIIITALLLCCSLQQQAQILEVSVNNIGNNRIQIVGVPTAPGFTAAPNNAWAAMNITWRIPKSAAVPTPTVAPPSATPEVNAENTEFTGAAPRNTFDGQMDLSIFDLTAFGQPDDNYWYFQVTGTVENVQNMAAGTSYVLYDFSVPWQWTCAACVEVLTTQVPGLPISTVSFIDNAGLGQDVLQLVTNNAPLPVEFISFEARKEQHQVQLNWRVASEENIRAYHVERSADGINYTSIGSVPPRPAAPFNDYAFTDATPMNGVNYYRIREEDIDGRAMYSDVRTVKMNESAFIVTMYPVPVKDELTVKLITDQDEQVYIRVTDVQGRMLSVRRVQLNAGTNLHKLPVNNLMNGMYFIEVAGSGKRWSGKFVKE